MKRSPYLVMDTETGGLDPAQNPITSFAAVVLDFNTLKEVDRWETYVKPYNDLQITKESKDDGEYGGGEPRYGVECVY